MSTFKRLRLAADVALACVGLAYVVTVCLTGRGRLPGIPGGHGFGTPDRWQPPPRPRPPNPAC